MALPQYPDGYEPYPSGWQPAPNGGTAIAAGVLASLGAVAELFGGLANVVLGATGLLRELDMSGDELPADSWFGPYLAGTGVVAIVVGVLLAWGAIALLRRKTVGRTLIAIGTGTAIVRGVVGAVVASMWSPFLALGTISGLLGLAFPIVTLILVLLPATTRWLAYDPAARWAPSPPPYRPPTDNPWTRPES
ncbi:hypothetical protein NDR87_23255 [Nocardia sp. CDC159]|uniref:Uncharacterized protein n=1 Tax=Nocardia pulmonis TaxID=2951408 RepID=A0A9X2EA02_9NOCA|nr:MULTISPECIES: hypothetical protein [Nocardia]MCM6776867.1 hypothetical protein [Nocardia pulmonis]MCM6789291.1 hypothetical protein [Nocardia sp. CDC159]